MAESYSHLTDSELAGVEAHVARLYANEQPGPWPEQLVELRAELDRRGVRYGSAPEAAPDSEA